MLSGQPSWKGSVARPPLNYRPHVVATQAAAQCTGARNGDRSAQIPPPGVEISLRTAAGQYMTAVGTAGAPPDEEGVVVCNGGNVL